jgi:hypothetical protein
LSLQSRGFYFTGDGQLLSNEGEMLIYTDDGVLYTLRFGEIAGTETSGEKGRIVENRYLFITTQYDSATFVEPARTSNDEWINKPDSLLSPADIKNRELSTQWNIWRSKTESGIRLSDELNNRFADWYYVISSKSFDKLQMRREELVVKKDDTKE